MLLIPLLLIASLISGLATGWAMITPSSVHSIAKTSQTVLLSADYVKAKGKATGHVSGNSTFGALMKTAPRVAGIASVSAEVVTPSPSPSPAAKHVTKSHYTIALFGDSMIDTLGPGIPHLSKQLAYDFPNIQFSLLNFGVGGENIEHGLPRLTNSYTYLGESKPAVLSMHPDVVIVESFAYNHWENTASDLNRQWLALATAVDIIKRESPKTKIVIAAAIAPYCPTYTNGSANLPSERKFKECETVKAYLQNAIKFAQSQKLLLVNAYAASLQKDGNGFPRYINQGDHIHSSDEGKQLFAKEVGKIVTELL